MSDPVNNVPTIHLAGRDWPIPKLAIKQNRVVVPLVLKLVPELSQIFAAIAAAEQSGHTMPQIDISEETFDRIATVVYTATTRATPGFARAEFDNLEIDLFELVEALNVVITQSGAFKRNAAPGEAKATMEISTSTSSSPITASAPVSPGPTT